MNRAVGILAAAVMAAAVPCRCGADLLKVIVLNDSHTYADDQVYVQMTGLDPSGSGKNGHVDLATSTWHPIAESDNTVRPPGGPWPHDRYTGYARRLSELTHETIHAYSFRMPHIISGRVYISFKQPAYFHVFSATELETPSAVDQNNPNYHLIFDKIELDWEHGKRPFLNTTTVDYFSISFMLGLKLRNGTTLSRGFTKSRHAIISELQNLPAPWNHGMVWNGGTPVRFVAPNKLADTKPFDSYFDDYVSRCWSYYGTKTLYLKSPPNAPAWKATGQVEKGAFRFTAGTKEKVEIKNLAGQGAHIFGCDGPGYLFTTGSDSIAKQGIIKTMGAALNRGVLYDGAHGIQNPDDWWRDARRFYAHEPTNLYSKVLHEAAYEGFCYGFSFDDVGEFSTGVEGDAAEVHIAIQPMSDAPAAHTVHLRPNRTRFATTGAIDIDVDVTRAIHEPFYPAFYIVTPAGRRLYLVEGNRLTPDLSAYVMQRRGKHWAPVAMTVPAAAHGIRLFSASFDRIPTGDYLLQGGAVDARAPIVNGRLNWIAGAEDTEILRVR